MTKHTTGTREEWLAARLELLEAEKELTRRSDELARRRQELPWVRIDKEYRFETDEGSASLADLFRGRSQLLVYHFMFGPDYTAGCPSCSAIADGFNGFAVHLANHDVMLSAVSRAPLAKLQAYKRRMGWTFPWASSFGSDFNFDFNVSFTEEQQREGASNTTTGARRRSALDAASGSGEGACRRVRGHDRNRRGHVHAREAGHERVRARGRRRLPHLFHLCARTGRPLGHVPVARPRTQGAQRDGRLVAPPRRVRQALSDVVSGFRAIVPSSRRLLRRLGAALRRQRGGDDRLVRVHVGDGRDADARRLDDVDGVDADARTDVARRRGVVPRHVGRDDGGDDAAVAGPDAVALPPGRRQDGRRRASVG